MPGNTNLGANFGIDVTNLKAGLKTANALIRESESEFRKAAAGMDDWTKSQEGLEAKITSLNKISDLQRQKVEALKKEYNNLVKDGMDPTSDKAIKLRTNINKEEEALEKTETELIKNKTALHNFGTESDKATTEVKQLADETEKGTGKFGAMDVALGNLVSKGITAAIDGFGKLAGAALDAYKQMDDGSDNVIKATGATGASADKLRESYNNVAKSFQGDFATIGNVLGEVNTRFGYSGKQLEETTKDFLRFADITGTDAKTAVADVSKALKAAGMEDKDYTKLLDQMARAAQASGISVSTLTDKLTKNGSTFRAMGFDTEETIALLAQFESAGVNTETAIAGMNTALKSWGSQGKNAKEEFQKALIEIGNAPTQVEKTQKVMETFGKKAGTELADAISTGRINYADFVKELKNSEGTVKNTYEETRDGFDEAQLAIQDAKAGMGEFVGDLLKEYGPTMKEGFGMIGGAIKGAIDFAVTFVETLGEGLGWIIVQAEKLWGWLKKLPESIDKFFGDISDGVKSVFEPSMKFIDEKLDTPEFRKAYESEHGKVSDQEWERLVDEAKGGIKWSGGGARYAKGGIVRHATQAIIGEAGAEVVMPLENNTGWIDMLAEKLGAQMGSGIVVNQTNHYTSAHSRYEIWKSKQEIAKAIKVMT